MFEFMIRQTNIHVIKLIVISTICLLPMLSTAQTQVYLKGLNHSYKVRGLTGGNARGIIENKLAAEIGGNTVIYNDKTVPIFLNVSLQYTEGSVDYRDGGMLAGKSWDLEINQMSLGTSILFRFIDFKGFSLFAGPQLFTHLHSNISGRRRVYQNFSSMMYVYGEEGYRDIEKRFAWRGQIRLQYNFGKLDLFIDSTRSILGIEFNNAGNIYTLQYGIGIGYRLGVGLFKQKV